MNNQGAKVAQGKCLTKLQPLQTAPIGALGIETKMSVSQVFDMKSDFTAVVFKNRSWYVGWCPEIKGANGQGKIRKAFLKDLEASVETMIDYYRAEALEAGPPLFSVEWDCRSVLVRRGSSELKRSPSSPRRGRNARLPERIPETAFAGRASKNLNVPTAFPSHRGRVLG